MSQQGYQYQRSPAMPQQQGGQQYMDAGQDMHDSNAKTMMWAQNQYMTDSGIISGNPSHLHR